MVMISFKKNDVTRMAWLITHRNIIGVYAGSEINILELLRKFKKAVSKHLDKSYIQDKIDVLMTTYPRLKPKKRS